MKKTLRNGILAVIISSMLPGCVKIREEATEERISKPHFDVEVPPPPAWDNGDEADDVSVGK